MARIQQMAVKIPLNREWFETHEELYMRLMRMSTVEEREKASRFVYRVDSWRMLLGRNLVRYYLSKVIRIADNPKDLVLDERQNGKPYLRNPPGEAVEFNISHAGKWVVIGVVKSSAELGIDVARIGLISGESLEELFYQFESYFSLHEWSQIESVTTKRARLHLFYQFWALKESYLKATGEGITGTDLSLVQFTILNTAESSESNSGYFEGVKTSIRLVVNSEYRSEYKFWLYYIDLEHVVALCCRPEHEFTTPVVIPVAQVLNVH